MADTERFKVIKIRVPGSQGPSGNGIGVAASQLDDRGHLILTFDDSRTVDVGKITGDSGVSISTVARDNADNLVVTLSSGQAFTFGNIVGPAGRPGGLLNERGVYDGVKTYGASDAVLLDGGKYFLPSDYVGQVSGTSPPTSPWIADPSVANVAAALAAVDAAVAVAASVQDAARIPDLSQAAASGSYFAYNPSVLAATYAGSTADYARAHEVGTDIAVGAPIDAIGAYVQVTVSAVTITGKLWSRDLSDTGQAAAGPGQVGDVLLATVSVTLASVDVLPGQTATAIWLPLPATIYAPTGKALIVEIDARDVASGRAVERLAYVVDAGSNQRRRGYYRSSIAAGTWSNIAAAQRLATLLGRRAAVDVAPVKAGVEALKPAAVRIGRPSAVVNQASQTATGSIFVFGAAMPYAVKLKRLSLYVKLAGTLTLSWFDAAGARLGTIALTVAVGEAAFTPDAFGTIVIPAGGRIGAGGAARYAYSTADADSAGCYQIAFDATTITGSAVVIYRHEIAYEFEAATGQVVDAARFLTAESNAAAAASQVAAVKAATDQLVGYGYQTIGRPDDAVLVTGSTASSAYIILYEDAVAYASVMSSFDFWAKTATTYTVMRCSVIAGTRTELARVTYTAAAIGLNTIPAETLAALGTFGVGEYWAVYGAVSYLNGAGADGAGWRPGGALNTSPVVVGVLNTTVQVQARAKFKRGLGQTVTGAALAAVQNAVVAADAKATQALATASPTFAQILIPGVYNASPAALKNIAKMKAFAGAVDARVVFVGDSTTRNYGGGDGGTFYNNIRENAHSSQMARAAAAMGTPARYDAIIGASQNALAADLVAEFAGRLALGSGWGPSTLSGAYSVGGQYFMCSAGAGVLSMASIDAWDTAILLFARTATAGGFQYKVDAGAPTTVNTAGTLGNDKVTIVAPGAGVHSININWLSGGPAYIQGAIFFNSLAPKVNFINAGWSGSEPDEWKTASPYSGYTNLDLLYGAGPNATFFNHGINSVLGATPVGDFKTVSNDILVKAKTFGDVIIQGFNPTFGHPEQADYIAALYQLSDSLGLPLIDWTKLFLSWDIANADGYFIDHYHCNTFGERRKAAPNIELWRLA